MGREWYLSWGIKSSKKGRARSGGAGGDGRRGGGSDRKAAAPPQVAAAAAVATGGCMNAVFHLFDFHQFQLCLQPYADNPDESFQPNKSSSLLNDPTISLKGIEAPKNSLEETEVMETGPSSLASITEDEKDYASHVPMGMQINTSREDTKLRLVQPPRGKTEDLSSESSCSPAGARTPNLVARLMGLDTLPESNTTTPRSSHSQHQHLHSPHLTTTSSASAPPTRAHKPIRTMGSYDNDVPGSRSSPETPRTSVSTRRRPTDSVEHHRLSLQINKENSIVKELESSRPSCSAISTKRREGRNYEEENRSPSYYARHIMKQVRESVSRRMGVDITNKVGHREHRRDEHLLTAVKPKKYSNKKERSPGKKNLTHSIGISPRFENLLDDQRSIFENAKLDSEESVRLTVRVQPNKSMEDEHQEEKKQQNCNNSDKLEQNLKKFGKNSSLKKPPKAYDSIRNKKEEQFVRPSTRANTSSDKKFKKTPLSSDLLHGSIVPTLKKDSSLPPPPKLLDKKGALSKMQRLKPATSTSTAARLSRKPSQRIYEKVQEEAMHMPSTRARRGSMSNKDMWSPSEFQYISRILKCTGIDRDTPVSFTRWFSPLHPLDPSIFHILEATHYPTKNDTSSDQLTLEFNRKLIFHLVDEILSDILKPYINLKPWVISFLSQDRRHYQKQQQQQQQQIHGFQLVKILCTRIRSFSAINCETLQDIDALVEKDFPRFGPQTNMMAFEEEGEMIVSEIEREIVDSLVQETAMFFF